MQIRVEQGARGRWRWLAYDGDTFRASGRVAGHPTKEKAERAAVDFFSQSVTLETEEEGELFAGQRDFSN